MKHVEAPTLPAGGEDPGDAWKDVREVYFQETDGYVDCNIYERSKLKAGNRITGPAIVEQMDTTTVLPPGETAEVDPYGSLIVELAHWSETLHTEAGV